MCPWRVWCNGMKQCSGTLCHVSAQFQWCYQEGMLLVARRQWQCPLPTFSNSSIYAYLNSASTSLHRASSSFEFLHWLWCPASCKQPFNTCYNCQLLFTILYACFRCKYLSVDLLRRGHLLLLCVRWLCFGLRSYKSRAATQRLLF